MKEKMKKVFLKLDGIKGESTNARHAGEIDISSFYWGRSRSSTAAARSGRTIFGSKDLTIIKRTDKTSPHFRAASASGQTFQGKITLEDYSAEGRIVRSITFDLDAVAVGSVTRIAAGELIALGCRSIKLRSASERKNEKEIKIMKRNLVIISIFLVVLALCAINVAAQLTIKMPNIKIDKPDKNGSKNKDAQTTGRVATNNVKTSRADLLYPLLLPTNVPVLLKNSISVSTVVHDEYWKMKGQSDFSSWVPKMRFSQYYNEAKVLNYTVEYFNPDGSPWYSEQLESSGRNAERTVVYESPSPYANGVLDTKSTAATGVYGFKITDQDTKAVLFQGKFKVGKFSRSYGERDKNKADFYVDHDWIMPFAVLGFHHSIDEAGAMRAEISVWLKGAVESNELEGRVFYKGRQIASTGDEDSGGVGSVEERMSGFAAAFEQQDKIWKRWEFSWENFRVHNNGGFNPENFPRAHFADRNPGEYTVKIYRSNTPIREISFTVGADGRFVAPAYSSQIPLPYYRLILPVKITGTTEKWNAAAWKTEAFYGNPLTGFAVQ